MQSCVIISSRPLSAALRRYIAPGAFVIAADAGWLRSMEIGVTPNLALGDFDSAPAPGPEVETLILPAEKNDTDTHFAAREALRRGFGQVTILGGMGGRPDHTMANYATLLFLAQNRVENLMADEATEVRCMGPGSLRLQGGPNQYLSVFAAAGRVQGVTLQGVKYPLHNAQLTMEYPLGVSNEFLAGEAIVSIAAGYVWVVVTQKDK
ncbi:MAG: thiamine diphosphokinase [Oscillospiraceae bacterium]